MRGGLSMWAGPRRRRSVSRVAQNALIAATTVVVALIGAEPVGANGGPSSPGSASQVAALVAASHNVTSLPTNLIPALTDVANDDFETVYPQTYWNCTTATQCVFGDTSSSTTIVLYGDSHAGMWLPAIIPTITAAHDRLVLLWYRACPVEDLSVWNKVADAPNTGCNSFRASARAIIQSLAPAAVIVADRTTEVRDFDQKEISWVTWETTARAAYRELSTPRTKVIVIGDISVLSQNPSQCLAANFTDVQACSVTYPWPSYDNRITAEKDAALQAKVAYIDPTKWLCTTKCSPVIGDFVAYTDYAHVSSTYAAYLSGVFGAALRPLL